jgi:exonuclease SbcC
VRPLELTLEGFKSYRHPQTFNFESRSLFGIVGPTGAGKSSILEALIFALYGKTPKVERDTKKLINSHEAQARVHLVFESDDIAWEVVRLIRRKGSSQTVLRRLGDTAEPVTGERNINDRIAEVLGLDFEAFCASVSLSQGEFDRFLKATPAQRSQILKGIFRLERVDLLREAARGRLGVIQGQQLTLAGALDALPSDPEALLEATRAELASAMTRLEQLNQALPATLKAEADILRSAELIEDIQRRRDETLAALAKLPADEALRDLADRHDAAGQRHSWADEALSRATTLLREAGQRAHEVESSTGGDAWVSAAEAAIEQRDHLLEALRDATGDLQILEQDLATSDEEVRQRLEDLHHAEDDAGQARLVLDELLRRHSAHVLRSGLVEGDACPVCEQTVVKVPGTGDLPALAAAEDRMAQAQTRVEEVRSRVVAAQRNQALAAERLRLLREVAARHQADLNKVNERIIELAGSEEPAAELLRRKEVLFEARSGVQSARAARESAEATEREARLALAQLSSEIGSLNNILSHTCGLLGIGSISIEDDGLWGAAKRVSEAVLTRVAELDRQAEALKEGLIRARKNIEEFRHRFHAEPGESASDLAARARADVARLEAKVGEVQAGIAKRRQIEEQLASLSQSRSLYERLVADFADSKFTAYLLDEQRRLLSRLGSEKFLELTGYFTFDEEGKFQVIDQRTGVTRTSDTLSGGETFLASLSLALALAEAVALEGGRLGCFFLDEGFGSLDSESLDLAMKGIEALATPGRLIGLISHVPGIQAWLDDLIVLERSADGTTEVVQHEGPIGYGAAII